MLAFCFSADSFPAHYAADTLPGGYIWSMALSSSCGVAMLNSLLRGRSSERFSEHDACGLDRCDRRIQNDHGWDHYRQRGDHAGLRHRDDIPTAMAPAALAGIAGKTPTMIGTAGPVMAVYFVECLPEEFIHRNSSVVLMVINLMKVRFMFSTGIPHHGRQLSVRPHHVTVYRYWSCYLVLCIRNEF